MKSILITGIPGAGKSTVSKLLRAQGITAIDLEEVPNLFVMVDKETKRPVKDYDNTNLEEVTAHDWLCDKTRLEKLIQNQNDFIAFYCGSASNMDELLSLFDKIILLKINERSMRHRLSTRPDNDFGGKPQIQDWVMTWKDWWDNNLIEAGAIVIDANKSSEEVSKAIIKMLPELEI